MSSRIQPASPRKPSAASSDARRAAKAASQTPSLARKNEIMAAAVREAKCLPPEIPVKEAIGKSGLMWPRTFSLSHPAADMLHKWATNGCPADCGPDWSDDQIIAALKRGAHPSAQLPEATEYLYSETTEKVKAGHLKVVRWGDIKANRPRNLKLSPVALIPHKSRSF